MLKALYLTEKLGGSRVFIWEYAITYMIYCKETFSI